MNIELNPELLSRINYITSYIKNDQKETGVVRLRLEKVSYDWVGESNKKHFHLVYDGEKIRRKNNYIVSFNCMSCNRENIVNLNNFARKIEKNNKSCFNCDHNDNNNNNNIGNINKFKSIDDKIINDKTAYFEMPLRKRLLYENKLMTPSHFENIKRYIISYNNDKFSDIDYTMYVPYYRPTESTKYFEPCFFDRNSDIVSRAINIKMWCHHCKHHFKIDSIRNVKKQFPIYCKMCEIKFGNIKPKFECNIVGQNVMFKTKMQHKFIKYCNNNEIVVFNGPNDITLYGVEGDTYIDFYIPGCKTYIDVVGNLEYQEDYENNDIINVTSKRAYGIMYDFISQEDKYLLLHPKNYVKETRRLLTIIESQIRR